MAGWQPELRDHRNEDCEACTQLRNCAHARRVDRSNMVNSISQNFQLEHIMWVFLL